MIIRNAEICDADAFWQMQYELDQETRYMMYEPGERTKDISRVVNLINSTLTGSNLLLLAEEVGQIVGFLSAKRGDFNRIRHSAYIVTGIRKAFQHQGIGKKFFEALDQWAMENQVKRLELTVMCPNQAAIKLYEKAGFEIEGCKRYSCLVDGEYIDEYYMAKLF